MFRFSHYKGLCCLFRVCKKSFHYYSHVHFRTNLQGGSIKDPLNLSSLESRTGPSPAPSPTTVATETAKIQSRNVPKVTNITDPLNLNVEIAAAAAASLSGGEEAAVTAELISPTGMRI